LWKKKNTFDWLPGVLKKVDCYSQECDDDAKEWLKGFEKDLELFEFDGNFEFGGNFEELGTPIEETTSTEGSMCCSRAMVQLFS
jgi:hypothetical protein